jgi:small neutral amino acid transporter SnatA (MarC family)
VLKLASRLIGIVLFAIAVDLVLDGAHDFLRNT